MNNRDKIKFDNEQCGCSPKYTELISDYVDNNIESSDIKELQNHISSCKDCREHYDLSLLSLKLTGKLSSDKNEYIDSISKDEIDFKTGNIMKAIMSESTDNTYADVKQSEEKAARNKIFSFTDSKNFKGFFNKRINRSFAGVAAAFFVLFSAAYLFGFFGNNSIIPTFNKGITTTETDNAFYGRNSVKDKSGMAQEDTKGSGGDATGDYKDNAQSAAAAEVIVSSKVVSEMNESSISPASDIIIDNFLNSEQTAAFYEITTDSIAFIQTSIPEYQYVGIYAFSEDFINDKKILVSNIFNNYTKPVKIEIISGENSQKLIEYTTKENTGYLQNATVGKNADFLIILIGR